MLEDITATLYGENRSFGPIVTKPVVSTILVCVLICVSIDVYRKYLAYGLVEPRPVVVVDPGQTITRAQSRLCGDNIIRAQVVISRAS